ncbi:MAG TPA: Calx-beta domain-containing protein [Acidimicrobiales bacterium]|nr:Calx-beta domain-containing protein [Acidimicrobiales bacterium]
MHWRALFRRKAVLAILGAVVLAAVVIPWTLSGAGASQGNAVIILARVQQRTLQSTVQLTGTLARKSLRNVTAATEGLLTAVDATDGSTVQAGQAMFSLNGRAAVAEPGTTPFFRALVPGDVGADVLQLKQILAAAGDYPGPVTDDQFTEQTQFALAQWQAQHQYPNSTPATTETANVVLQQGTGYQLGAQDSAGITIGPPPAQTSATRHGAGAEATLLAYPRISGPTVTIQSESDQVAQGQSAVFVLSASPAPSGDLTVNLDYGGTAGSQDVITPPSTVTIPAGATSATLEVATRVTTAVEAEPTLTVTVDGGTGYSPGSPDTAQTTITNANVPQLSITGGTTVAPGASATLTVTADQAPIRNTQVLLSFAGDATPGTDYTPPDPVVTLPAGATSATVSVATLASDTIGPDKYVVVGLSPSPGSYTVGTPGSAVVTIGERTGTPVVTLSSATTFLDKGQPYQVALNLSAPSSSALTVNLTYGGSAVEGTDYSAPPTSVVVPPGQTSAAVTVPTVASDQVEADRTLSVALAPGSGYVAGTPGTVSVTISSQVLPKLTLRAAATSITEGGAATFTITADQAPTQDTSVNFAVEGTAEPGQDYEPLAGVALLQAGQTSVTVTLQSLEKDVTFEPTDMITGAWPIRVGTVYLKAGQSVAPGTPILELTEPTASVTLQASPSDRTNLSVGQQCTVQISGGTTQVSGTITELDATPTDVSSGQGSSSEVYEGRIDSSDLTSLNGADGSTVSINVVDQQATDALTVPIAAVKQNGVGDDVVRVLGATGAITEVPVVTGLSEGSYIQVKSGLSLGQTVVVQSDQT